MGPNAVLHVLNVPARYDLPIGGEVLNMGTTQELATWAAGIEYGELPDVVVARSRAAIIDTTAAILAGVREPVTRIVSETVAADGCRPVAAQLGTALRTSPENAALLNGVSGHALDYDDVSASVEGHPSVVLLPAALAGAEMAGASGRDLLCGYAIGVEAMAKLALALGPIHYRAGWHATSTVGTLGAAAAAGRLLRLDQARMAAALGIAASEASGSRQNFGTMTKPFHAGHAARCGVQAARLAGGGMTAGAEALEGRLGYLTLFSGSREPDAPAHFGAPWDLEATGLSVKKYPCCFATHRAADGLLAARARGLRPEEVEEISVKVPRGGFDPLIYERATTGLEGKFCLGYTLAAALWDGRLGLDTFTDQMVARPQVQRLAERVRAEEDPAFEVRHNPIEEGHVDLKVRLRDGSEVTERVEQPLGSPRRPLDADDLRAKYRDCAATVLPAAQVESSLRALERLEALASVTQFVSELTPAAVAIP